MLAAAHCPAGVDAGAQLLRLQRVAAQLAPGVEGPDPATHRAPFALHPFGWWLGSPAALAPSQAGLELSAAAPEAEVLAEFRRTGCVVLTELLPRVLIEECAEATLRRVDEFVRRKGPTWDLVAMTEQQGEQTRALSAASAGLRLDPAPAVRQQALAALLAACCCGGAPRPAAAGCVFEDGLAFSAGK